MSSKDTLAQLLGAKRLDLVDGFACKAVLKVLSLDGGDRFFKLKFLNELLAEHRVVVTFTQQHDLMFGFEEADLAGALITPRGDIEVNVLSGFFRVRHPLPALTRALRFQSLVCHELVHRWQFQQQEVYALNREKTGEDMIVGRTAEALTDKVSTTEYLNDTFELWAMGAEIAHDMRTQAYLGTNPELTNASPRFDDLMKHASQMSHNAILKLQESIRYFY